MSKVDGREWRTGNHWGIHLYAINPGGEDEPLGTMLTADAAEQAVREHNAARAAETSHSG